jgi:hypothetical protein
MVPAHSKLSNSRIALFWDTSALLGQRIQAGVYRESDQHPCLLVRRFESTEVELQKRIVLRMKQWQPDGVVIYSGEVDFVHKLRSVLKWVYAGFAVAVQGTF